MLAQFGNWLRFADYFRTAIVNNQSIGKGLEGVNSLVTAEAAIF
jgi:hypothetical protein